MVLKPAQLELAGFLCGKNRCNGSVPVQTPTRNRSSGLELLLTLLRTAELVHRDFHWPVLDAAIQQFIASCKVCHRIKALRYARHGVNMPLPPPFHAWEGIIIDFVMYLPKSMNSGSTRLAVIVDRLTTMAIYLSCRKDINSPELAHLFFAHLICKHGVPDNIITGHGTQFTRRFWI